MNVFAAPMSRTTPFPVDVTLRPPAPVMFPVKVSGGSLVSDETSVAWPETSSTGPAQTFRPASSDPYVSRSTFAPSRSTSVQGRFPFAPWRMTHAPEATVRRFSAPPLKVSPPSRQSFPDSTAMCPGCARAADVRAK